MKNQALNIFVPFDIQKTDDEKHLVYGYASTETIDSQGEIVEKAAIEGALDDYLKWANIREMHNASAVGTAQEATMDHKGLYICAKISDPVAWVKVKEKVYKGFSIGGSATKKVNKVIKTLKMTEISLVDRPANPDAVIELWKSDSKQEDKIKKGKSFAKSYWNMVALTRMIYDLNELRSNIEAEQEMEGDEDSQLSKKVQDAISVLIGLFEAMSAEEMAEIRAGTEVGSGVPEAVEMMAKTEALQKAGKRNNKIDQSSIQSIHDMAEGLGAMCKKGPSSMMSGTSMKEAGETVEDIKKDDAGKIINKEETMEQKDFDQIQKMFQATVAPISEAVTKLEDKVKTQDETIKKQEAEKVQKVEGLTKENETLRTEIKQLKEQPVDNGKGVTKIASGGITVDKTQDIGKFNQELLTEVQNSTRIQDLVMKRKAGDQGADDQLKEEAISMIKKIHKTPGREIAERKDVVREATMAKV
jgi:phage head maturation protease